MRFPRDQQHPDPQQHRNEANHQPGCRLDTKPWDQQLHDRIATEIAGELPVEDEIIANSGAAGAAFHIIARHVAGQVGKWRHGDQQNRQAEQNCERERG